MQFPQWWKVSEYLSVHSAQDAKEATKVPFVWAMGKEGMSYYDAIEEDPVVSDIWHKGMIMIEATQPISGMFPFASMQAAVEAEPERAFVVDVGGGRGNALIAMMKECGGSYGAKMVLQDQAEVLQGKDPVKLDGVENMPHNFYDPQPVQSKFYSWLPISVVSKNKRNLANSLCLDAHIYFLRNILHNHYDERSLVILRRVVDAMGPTSRILIGEMILPATATAGSDPFPFFMDLNMFMQGGVERTEQQFGELLGKVGLEIKRVWRHPDNPVQSTIEAMLKK